MAKIKVKKTPQPAIYSLLTQKQLNRRANQQAAAALKASQAPILQQQQIADQRAAAARQAMQAVGAAGASILQPVGDRNAAAYDQATKETANLVGGLTGQLGAHMAADQAAASDFRSKMAPGSASQEQVNPENVQNATYDLGAVIPGSSLAEQGAAATAYGNEMPAIPLSTAANQEAASVGQQGLDDQQYADQLLQLAQQEPQVRAQILDQLYQTEASKANALTQQQAQNLYAAEFGQKTAYDNAQIGLAQQRVKQTGVRLQLQQQGLRLRSQSQALAVKKANIDWSRIDSSASKATGYLMTKGGQYVTDKNGKKIPVAVSSTAKSPKFTGPGSTAYRSAYSYASSHFMPKYIAPGVVDPTQVRPSFVQMQSHLVNAYGVSRAQARKILVGLGIKPDGKRPKK